MLGQRCTLLPLPVPIHEARSLKAEAFITLARRGPHPRTPGQPEPYPFEGRPQAKEGDEARTKRALAEIGMGVMPRGEGSKKGPGRDRSGSQNFGCWGDAIGP